MQFTLRLSGIIYVLSLFAYEIYGQNTELSGLFGTFSSPDFPQTYPNDVNTTWRITVRAGYRVRLYFTVFDIEDSFEPDIGFCAYDYIKINEKRWCGNFDAGVGNAYQNAVYKSDENVMIVQFVSDYSNEDPNLEGFVAHYAEEDINECKTIKDMVYSGVDDWDLILYCSHECHNTRGSYYCSCRPGFTLHSNRHTCVADCADEAIVEREGMLMSPEYPNLYSKLSDCESKIDVGVGRTIEIRFEDSFEIEKHFELGCVYDWLKVDGGRADTEYTFCGSVAPFNGSWHMFDSSTLSVTLHSDLSVEHMGYKMYYRSRGVQCREEIIAPQNGEVTSAIRDVYEHGDIITIGCLPGYEIAGNSEVTCFLNGTWGKIPACEIISCPFPKDIINRHKIQYKSNIFELEVTYQSTFSLDCQIWYGKSSGVFDWICAADKTWQPASEPVTRNTLLPVCTPECGVKNQANNLNILGFVLGGRKSRIGEWPWMAYISLSPVRKDTFCGGSLVSEQYVISAAHCFGRYEIEDIRVDLGVTNRKNSSNVFRQSFRVIEWDIHENFSKQNPLGEFDSDIAILKLSSRATINRFVRPICLPRSVREKELPQRGLRGSDLYQERGVVIGWGYNETRHVQDISRTGRVPLVPMDVCIPHYTQQTNGIPAFRLAKVSDNMLCAGFLNRVRDSCNGDSGGPLSWRDLSSNRWFLNGVVSFGTTLNDCNVLQGIGIYTNVGKFVEYIDEIIG